MDNSDKALVTHRVDRSELVTISIRMPKKEYARLQYKLTQETWPPSTPTALIRALITGYLNKTGVFANESASKR